MPQPPDWLLTPDSIASPPARRDGAAVRWYLPTWRERLLLTGWRNVVWVAPLGVLATLAAIAWLGGPVWGAIWAWWKLIVLAVTLPISIVLKQSSTALRHRADPFCIHCGYSLAGLADGHACPECGEVTPHAVSREYQRDPHAFIDRARSARTMPKADVPFDIRRDAPLRGDGT